MANTDALVGLKIAPLVDGLTMRLIDHDGPASYTTGGETVNASALGFKQVFYVSGAVSQGGGNVAEGAILNKKGATSFKVVWFVRTTGAEVANAVNLSTDSVKLMVFGIGS